METIDDRSVSLEYMFRNYINVSNLSEEEKKSRNIAPNALYVKKENIACEKYSEEKKREMDSIIKEMYGEGTDDYKFLADMLEQL